MTATVNHTHLLLIPSYNTGKALLRRTVAEALRHWQPVWVVVDGSTDGSDDDLESLGSGLAAGALRIIRRSVNGGKGAAVLDGMRAAQQQGYSHTLCFDADGQHPADQIAPMMAASIANPQAAVFGQPVFGKDAPLERLLGRRIANFFTEWESGHCGLGDTLFGMRVYPVTPTIEAFSQTRFARRFDFDPEIAVRLCWQGVQPLPFPVPCRYLSAEEGGVSHFNYLRDNLHQLRLHFRLLPTYLLRKRGIMRQHIKRWSQQGQANATSPAARSADKR